MLGSVEEELLQIFTVAHPEDKKRQFEIYFVPNLKG
jgi:hypothetical protein